MQNLSCCVCCPLLGHGLCDSVCKSATLAHATDNTDIISGECRALMHGISFDSSDLRGVRLCSFYSMAVTTSSYHE